ncbi:MAG: DEAD/DEAH box helicase [Planctomycetota bacterium]|nr:DEAD/DEAH box helicase [Planctomycetota bacterium]
MLVLHAAWSKDSLQIWAESEEHARESLNELLGQRGRNLTPEPDLELDQDAFGEDLLEETAETSPREPTSEQDPAEAPAGDDTLRKRETTKHAFVEDPDKLRVLLERTGAIEGSMIREETTLTMHLPHRMHGPTSVPEPSERLASELGWSHEKDALQLEPVIIGTLSVHARHAAEFLVGLEDRLDEREVVLGHDTRFWIESGRLILDLLREQRFIPTMSQERDGILRATWIPWLNDREASARAAHLLSSTPAVACAVEENGDTDAWGIVELALRQMCDSTVRDILIKDDYPEAIEDRDLLADQHAGWLSGLLNGINEIPVRHGGESQMLRNARHWISHLDDRSASRVVRLCMQLSEPEVDGIDPESTPRDAWWLSYHLITTDDPPIIIDAEKIWAPDSAGDRLLSQIGNETETAADVLLAELARAARICPKLERSLEDSSPIGLELSLEEAYEFLRELRPLLQESGVEVLAPDWWGQMRNRLAAHLIIDSESMDSVEGKSWGSGPGQQGELGLHSLVDYSWQITLGDRAVSVDEFRNLAAQGTPLVRINGTWVEIRREDAEGAAKFIEEHPGGQMTVLDAMKLAHGVDNADIPIPVVGMKATGWVAQIFGEFEEDSGDRGLQQLPQPSGFQGELRPYQRSGLSWLAFLDRFGLGACLADDMGLGKTIQLIALLQHERETSEQPELIGPTLLVVPMSVLGNWRREFERFSPELKVHLQHGIGRPMDDAFREVARTHDVIVTTYALVTRDREMLETVDWWRVTLDEAQHIKNPPTKQTAAIRALQTRRRIALTGTPVENRLAELWSIMEFCCPGFLGANADFRKRFALPIERHRDEQQARKLRELVQPFILRRLKTDPKVISDLPPLVQSKQSIAPSDEQVKLYDTVVEEMLQKVDSAEGIRRRGLVLASLVKLKQICNHPAHYLESIGQDAGGVAPERSGKSLRLMEMLDEVIATEDRALIFTQYRRMGHLLVSMIRQAFDIEPLFLHGGTPQVKRDQLVERFQSFDPACPIFILSLKAGGVGLNLTAANHVFHFDRWWNPAVENQATDRAFRIGQNRTVNVHKMITSGTLEERIDQMIEQKTELAERIIGAGESWLTELSTGQLRDLLSIRHATLEESTS